MNLTVPTRKDVQKVRQWRNEEPKFLRTPYLLTEEMQDDFYDDVICNRGSKHRYFSIYGSLILFGLCGLTNIEWENGCAEISLIINPEYRSKGYGRKAVNLILEQGFDNMRLETIYGEVYHCGNVGFWRKIVDSYGGYRTVLIGRKFYDRKLYGSDWFAITQKEWRGRKKWFV